MLALLVLLAAFGGCHFLKAWVRAEGLFPCGVLHPLPPKEILGLAIIIGTDYKCFWAASCTAPRIRNGVMSIRALLLYLVGNERSILRLASDRRASWIGLLFVLSAGFAREYDGEDLLRRPWHLLLPLAASLASSFLLFLLLYLQLVWTDPDRPPFFSAYLSFLGLFWLTAPLAWLYAIPYERFMPESQAIVANLLTLGLVALWRVGLMVRVASVLFGHRTWAALGLVMAYGEAVALLAVLLLPINVIHTMSGTRGVTPKDDLLLSVQSGVVCSAVCLLPVWVVVAVAFAVNGEPAWRRPGEDVAQPHPPAWGLWGLAIASVVVWALVLPLTQREQQLRSRVEHDLAQGQLQEAFAEMSAHTPADFPPHWDPPPVVSSPRHRPDILDAMDVILDHPPAPWGRERYLLKFRAFVSLLGDSFSYNRRGNDPLEDRMRVVRIVLRLPEGREVVRGQPRLFKELLERGILPIEERGGLKALLEDAERERPPEPN